MASTIKQLEAIPVAYPATPAGLSTAAAALDPDVIWQRIESYTSHRFTDREVIWTVSESGVWQPPLSPAVITATEEWADLAWVAITPDASALGGYAFDGDGPFRITADVGSGAVPAAVNQAFVRLAEYTADSGTGPSGATSISYDVGPVNVSQQRSATWLARAMQNSGAADLLRPYRKA